MDGGDTGINGEIGGPELGRGIRCKLPGAANPLCHFVAVAMHLLAAGALRLRHRVARGAGQDRRGGEEEEEQSHEGNEATHAVSIVGR
jgi:hypothetical protein